MSCAHGLPRFTKHLFFFSSCVLGVFCFFFGGGGPRGQGNSRPIRRRRVCSKSCLTNLPNYIAPPKILVFTRSTCSYPLGECWFQGNDHCLDPTPCQLRWIGSRAKMLVGKFPFFTSSLGFKATIVDGGEIRSHHGMKPWLKP